MDEFLTKKLKLLKEAVPKMVAQSIVDVQPMDKDLFKNLETWAKRKDLITDIVNLAHKNGYELVSYKDHVFTFKSTPSAVEDAVGVIDNIIIHSQLLYNYVLTSSRDEFVDDRYVSYFVIDEIEYQIIIEE
jgi:hypothetical protein